jgi:hypothetical protein
MSEYNRHKFAMEWMHGGGRDPNGRGLEEEIQIANDMWKERVSMAEGGVPQLVQPGPGRQGYGGKNLYYRASTKEWIVYKRPPGVGGEKKQTYPFKKKSDALKFLEKGKESRLKGFEKTRDIRTKEVNKAYDNINSWTKTWLNKNMPEYTAKEFPKFEKDLAKAWAKELKTNSSLYPKDIKGIRLDLSTKTNLPWARELKLSGLTSPIDKTSDTFFKKVFYKEKLKNPEFKKKVKDYLDWVVADKKLKTTKAKYAGLETPGSQAGRLKHLETAKINQFDEDVIHLISEMQKGDPSGVYTSLKEQFPDLLKKYSYKVSLGTTKWRENLRVVAKNAGLDPDLLYKQMRNETAEVAKRLGVSVDKIPDELRYAIDHLGGLAEAANYTGPNKADFSRKTLNTLVARTREQNDILGRQTLSIPRSKLIRKFNKAKTLDDKVKIVGEINELVEKHIPGEIKYKVTGSGNLDFKALEPQKTIKARAAAYEKIPEVKAAKKIKPSVSDSKGLLGEGWSKFAKAAPKTTGALAATRRFLFHPVEMGMLPLFLAGDALYQNYANKRDLQKVLDEIPLSGEYGMPQYKKDLIMEGYIQQARDKGGVGLETYAIDQPNISGALEKMGFGDPNFLAQKAGEAIAGKREEERQAYEAERERQRKIYDIDAPMMAKGGRVSYLDGGIVSLLKK